MKSCEKVFGNVDLVTLIFKYLDFGDQLRFAQVNDQLRNAYGVCLGNVNYSSLYIYRHNIPWCSKISTIVIADDMSVYGKCLEDASVLMEFLVLYADSLRDLLLFRIDETVSLDILRKTRYLRSLSTYGMNFTRAMAENLPAELQELNILDSFAGAYGIVDKIRRRMTNLHKLQIIDGEGDFGINCSNLIQFYFPKLEYLKLNVNLHRANVSLPAAGILKQLDIRLQDEQRLKRQPLQYLKVLHLALGRYTNQLFPILTESCASLETLTLENFNFGIVTTISLPPKVSALSFLECVGLSHSCLKRILTEFQFIKFCSRDTNYNGDFHDFQISSHIQSMEIDFVNMTKFRSAFENNRQLKELIWKVQPNIFVNPFLFHDYVAYDVCLQSTPNLERLEIPYMPTIGSLTLLKSLQSLRLILSRLPEWSEIVDLLKHSTLQELSIVYAILTLEKNVHPVVEDHQATVMSFHTNISRLTIQPQIFETWMNYCLKLFSTNLQLTLVCWPIPNEKVLSLAKELVEHQNFPRKLKTMDVCCFTIDCEELRRNFAAVRCKFLSCMSFLNELKKQPIIKDNLKMARRNRIVLSWKYEYNF